MTHFFIHIPKTAGTSYRKAFEKKYGSKSIAYDYGPKSPETFGAIKETYDTKEALSKSVLANYKLVAGHVPLSKYAGYVGYNNCITFLRDPIERSYSDYLHVVRHYGYAKSLEEYLSSHQHRNRQSKFLNGVPSGYIGFIGLTECYAESLDLLRLYCEDLAVSELKLNINSNREAGYDISDQDREMLITANEQDLALYRRVEKEFKSQLEVAKSLNFYCSGRIQKIGPKLVKGWLTTSSDQEVVVEALIGDTVVASVIVNEERPMLTKLNVGFSNNIGFTIRNREVDMTQVSVRVKGTHYYLSAIENLKVVK